MKKESRKQRKKKGMQTDPLMEKVNAKLNKYIMLFYFAGVAVYLIWELINKKNQSKI